MTDAKPIHYQKGNPPLPDLELARVWACQRLVGKLFHRTGTTVAETFFGAGQ